MTTSRQQYIEQYAEYAMEQMRKYGIPASVTLAQGIIESANGKSTLSQTANNHFGVKGTYNGSYVLAADDKPNEKFKKYDNVGQSYEDHSKVLMSKRYQQYVGNLSPDDYKGWASGIFKGGYATDKRYVSTIVGVIEGAGLHKYDNMVMQQMKAEGRQFGVKNNPLSNGSFETTKKGNGMNNPQSGYSMPIQRSDFMLVTSPYGQRADPIQSGKTQVHHGIDIKTNKENVFATENNGVVIGVDHRTTTGGGKSVTVEYSRQDGSKTRVQYMHLSEIAVKKGDIVNAGQKLGVSGATGTRVTGEHLHLGVINVSSDNKLQWVNPAAYLAEISQKGNINIEMQHNGKNLLAAYKPQDTPPAQTEVPSPENWMNKLLSSDDAALGLTGNSGTDKGLLGNLMDMFVTLLMLSIQMSNKSREDKMQTVSDALVDRKIDISDFAPNLKYANLVINDQGNVVLVANDSKQEYRHELTEAEKASLSKILHSDNDEAIKKQRVGCVINAITFSQQASNNYELIESQQQSQEQTIQRK